MPDVRSEADSGMAAYTMSDAHRKTERKNMKLHSTLPRIAVALVALLCVLSAAAQTKPDLSGTWKLNAEKSTGDWISGSLKIDHKGLALSENWQLAQTKDSYVYRTKYMIDNSQPGNGWLGQRAETNVSWDGDSLVIEEWNPEGQVITRNMSLSSDGKTLTVLLHLDLGEVDTLVIDTRDTLIFERQ
jgi:hypothetical protein